ncbi:hypothetical protein BGZ81_006227 [Podila clonocystis]|nr:hypothetical protein BGZ81_006227 [Podila clonocystis]
MYLTQRVSALLFTVIRLALQLSSIFFISHLASRTRNLTYHERINGGFLNGIHYLLFTKFSPRRQHLLGRFYVALALVITLALNYLPTLLSDIYPVLSTLRPSNLKELDISTAYVKTISIVPNNTSVENILSGMGVQLNGSIFDSYVAPHAERLPCFTAMFEVNCSNENVTFGGFNYVNFSLAIGPAGGVSGLPRSQSGRTPAGERFEYFNATDATGSYGLAQMFVTAGEAEAGRFYDMTYSSPRSLETCLTKASLDHRCVRHSIGYLLSKTYRLFLITRRVYTQTFTRTLSQTFNTTIPEFIDPSVNTTLDCSRLPTLNLEIMCRQINSLGAPPMYKLYTIQKQWRDNRGRTHWDVVTTRVNILANEGYVNNTLSLTLEVFHLDAGAEYYNSTLDDIKSTRAVKGNNMALLQFMGRETFEATYLVPMETVSHYNHSWVNWGFSQEDIHNLTNFLLGGTMLNSGTLMMQTPVLLANVSDLTVGFLLGASVAMVVLGLLFSRGVDSAARYPITEVFSMLLDSRRPEEKATPSLRYRRVANLTLVSSQVSESLARAPNPSALKEFNVENDKKGTATAHKTKTLLLRMEIDSDDDEINVIELFETKMMHHPPASSDVQGQSNSSMPLLSEPGQHSITSSTFP